MKTEEEIEDDIFKVVNGSALAKELSGKIYTGIHRPTDSTKEDITIKCLSMSLDSMRDVLEAYVNVNIYIADKLLGKSYEKNRVRIRTISSLAESVLHRAGKGNDFSTLVESIQSYEAEGTKQPEHFINIKVKHKSVE